MMVWDRMHSEKTKEERALRIFFSAFLLVFFFCLVCPGVSGSGVLRIFAAEGTVSFGPESYAWNIGEVNTLVVSFHGDTAVDRYAVCLEYDPAILEYLDGADRVDGRQIWLEGGGGEDSYERILMFRPRKSGNTQVKVVSASANGGQAPDGTDEGEERGAGAGKQAFPFGNRFCGRNGGIFAGCIGIPYAGGIRGGVASHGIRNGG